MKWQMAPQHLILLISTCSKFDVVYCNFPKQSILAKKCPFSWLKKKLWIINTPPLRGSLLQKYITREKRWTSLVALWADSSPLVISIFSHSWCILQYLAPSGRGIAIIQRILWRASSYISLLFLLRFMLYYLHDGWPALQTSSCNPTTHLCGFYRISYRIAGSAPISRPHPLLCKLVS